MLLRNKYELWVLQEAAIGSCSGGHGGYNVGGYNSVGGYSVGGNTMVACSALHKQLYWEFGVSHNCVCIISNGPLMYDMTCLETLCSFNRLFNLILRFSFNWLAKAIALATVVRVIGICNLR